MSEQFIPAVKAKRSVVTRLIFPMVLLLIFKLFFLVVEVDERKS